uniref:Uncharacterized protein n=1 Tax=Leersia perrieri TaxID=77586 RepID=A0A0D9W2U0_9ORYZ
MSSPADLAGSRQQKATRGLFMVYFEYFQLGFATFPLLRNFVGKYTQGNGSDSAIFESVLLLKPKRPMIEHGKPA